MSIQCPNCKILNDDAANLCNNCGSILKGTPKKVPPTTPFQRPETLPEEVIRHARANDRPEILPEDQHKAPQEEFNPKGTGWRPSSSEDQQREISSSERERKPGGSLDKQKRRSRKRIKIVGDARFVHEDPPQNAENKVRKVLFRVEQYDKAGNRLQPIPVMVSRSKFMTPINEGDQVEVVGRWHEGQYVKASKLYNRTAASKMKGSWPSSIMNAIRYIYLAPFVVITLLFWLLMVFGLIGLAVLIINKIGQR